MGEKRQLLYQSLVLKDKLLGWVLPLPHPEPPVLFFFPERELSEPLSSIARQNYFASVDMSRPHLFLQRGV